MPRKRKVFGRRTVKRDGVFYRLEMRKDRLVAREKWSRREHVMSLDQIVDYVTGQLPLKLN